MAVIQTQKELQNAIEHLEQRQLLEKNAIEKYYHESYEYLKPVNFFQNVIKEISDADALKKDMLKAAIALTIGFLAKKIIETYVIKSKSPLATGIETVIQIIISGWVAKNGTILKDIIIYFFKTILQYRQKQLLLTSAE